MQIIMGRRKVVQFCSVRGCPNFGRNFRKSANVHEIPIFKCPTPNNPMLKKWLKALNMQDYDSRIQVCLRHFEEGFIIREETIVNHDGSTAVVPLKKPILSKNAVPTVFDEMSTKLGSRPLVRMWRGGSRKYAHASPQALCSVTLQAETRERAEDEDSKVEQDINVLNVVIIKQDKKMDTECQQSVESEAFVSSHMQKRKRIKPPERRQVKKPRAKELFYPCPVCHLLIQRRRQMISHMQRRHPDHELTKSVLKEREINPRGHYRSLGPYLSLAIKAPEGFHNYPPKDDDCSYHPFVSDWSLPPSDSEDPLAVEPVSTESPAYILPEPFCDDTSATILPDISTPFINTAPELFNSKSIHNFPSPSPPSILPIHVNSYPTSTSDESVSAGAPNSSLAHPFSNDTSFPSPLSDPDDAPVITSWDLSAFKVHLYNIPMEKKEFLKKRLMEVVEAVTVRNLDPERILITCCDRSNIKS